VRIQRLPRMRGDRPRFVHYFTRGSLFTPHARGSTSHAKATEEIEKVYPACAGIDPSGVRIPPIQISLPRMRGDRP